MTADHHANGPIVASVRRWLAYQDDHNGYGGEEYHDEELSCLTDSDGADIPLTTRQIRILLAEHDAYRNEARQLRENQTTATTAAATDPGKLDACCLKPLITMYTQLMKDTP